MGAAAAAGAVTNKTIENAKKLEKVASWVKGGLASAFFASLEKCSCIHLATTDEDNDDADAGETDRTHLMRSCKADGIALVVEDEASVQNWAEQTLPFMSSPFGMGRFT
ncbi:hypothetical protein GOP47_0014974 [Adiantum capillus-veneris]|uniref:Uncharacterized protein n=1 Tax=Adiantum capillus-veneris TaxID=13818 RepID=A0A9D4ZFA9_ADICA|nr:hypothetical protein GOP47_0014974 [Adiantum capillus-veneris]